MFEGIKIFELRNSFAKMQWNNDIKFAKTPRERYLFHNYPNFSFFYPVYFFDSNMPPERHMPIVRIEKMKKIDFFRIFSPH